MCSPCTIAIKKRKNKLFICIQLPLTSLRTFDVTHSRLVTHFRIIESSKNKSFDFLILHKLGLLYIFNLKYAFKC